MHNRRYVYTVWTLKEPIHAYLEVIPIVVNGTVPRIATIPYTYVVSELSSSIPYPIGR